MVLVVLLVYAACVDRQEQARAALLLLLPRLSVLLLLLLLSLTPPSLLLRCVKIRMSVVPWLWQWLLSWLLFVLSRGFQRRLWLRVRLDDIPPNEVLLLRGPAQELLLGVPGDLQRPQGAQAGRHLLDHSGLDASMDDLLLLSRSGHLRVRRRRWLWRPSSLPAEPCLLGLSEDQRSAVGCHHLACAREEHRLRRPDRALPILSELGPGVCAPGERGSVPEEREKGREEKRRRGEHARYQV